VEIGGEASIVGRKVECPQGVDATFYKRLERWRDGRIFYSQRVSINYSMLRIIFQSGIAYLS
jgi:hypothetical protein